jgi:hypothetical protein
VSIILSPQFSFEGDVYEGRGRQLVKKRKLVLPITYKPDFVGSNWIMEVKGHRRPDFDLRWKLFKHMLHTLGAPYTLLMPRNNKQLDECIEIIKELGGQDKTILPNQEGIKLPALSATKSPLHETSDGWGNSGRGEILL